MSRSWKVSLPAVFIVIFTVGLVSGSWLRERAAAAAPSSSPVVAALELAAGAEAPVRNAARNPQAVIGEAWDKIETYYVEALSEDDRQHMAGGAVAGMLQALAQRQGWVDLYTRYLDSSQFNEFTNESRDAFFYGIGAQLEWAPVPVTEAAREALGAAGVHFCPNCGVDLLSADLQARRVQIATPLPASPALDAGIQAGDVIVGIDSDADGPAGLIDARNLTLDEAVSRIRGQENTPVTLHLERADHDKVITVTIVRKRIDLEPVESKLLDDGTFYIRLSNFSEPADTQMTTALRAAREQGARGIVLDLRSNPGGLLHIATRVARDFVPTGPIVYVQERGTDRRELAVPPARHTFTLPLVVLVNRGTASGAEILAGAIQHAQAGAIVGERTWGKGLVQSVLRLGDGSAMLLVTARYFTAGGQDINKQFDDKGQLILESGGILPDVVVEQPEGYRFVPLARVPGANDAQLARALELLRERHAGASN